MSGVLFVADPHVRNHPAHGGPRVGGTNRRCREHCEVLARAALDALELDARLVVLGDVFDQARPSPPVVRATWDALTAGGDAGRRAIVIPGNHDLWSGSRGDHALASMLDPVRVYDEPAVVDVDGVRLWLAPYRPGPAREWLPEVVHRLADIDRRQERICRKILCLHLGVAEGDEPEFLRAGDDVVDAEQLAALMGLGLNLAVAGNWHGRSEWERPPLRVIQPGTLVPCRHTDDGLGGWGLHVAADSIAWRRYPGPRFATVDSLVALKATLTNLDTDDRLYLRARVPLDEHDAVADAAGADARVVACEVLPPDEDLPEPERAPPRDLPIAEVTREVAREVAEREGVDAEDLLRVVEGYQCC